MPDSMPEIYDLAIIGGGPAGAAASVYASRKKLRSVLLTESWGGQSIVSDGIENWIGNKKISGADLAKDLEAHAREYADGVVDFVTGGRVEKLEKTQAEDGSEIFIINTNKNQSIQAKAILIASGSKRRQLNVLNADKFEHKGITYCASCDGPVFSGQDVVVLGGGNAGFESASQLLAYCKSVTLIHRNENFKADKVTVDAVLAHPNMKVITNAEVQEVNGEAFVSSITYKDKTTGQIHQLPTAGIFVEIGAIPNTDFIGDLVEKTEHGSIVVNPRNQRTSCAGIWSAGDCTDSLYQQNNIAAGDAVKALEDIYIALHTNKK